MNKKIIHYDLFAGIGGFSLALDTVFYDKKNEHIFCEWEQFPTAVLKKHWPDATYYGDIADLVTDTNCQRRERERKQDEGRHGLLSGEISDQEQEVVTSDTNSSRLEKEGTEQQTTGDRRDSLTILTGGFPCQPFSHAGRRQGTADDRYLWPSMFAVIQNVRPDWVIAENVRGLASWNEGMVLETVCADLESEGYEVRPYIIPAVAVGAPHRRDRVWIVAHTVDSRQGGEERSSYKAPDRVPQKYRTQDSPTRELERTVSDGVFDEYASNTRQQLREQGSSKGMETNTTVGATRSETNQRDSEHLWKTDWREVAFATCIHGLYDGLSFDMGGVTISGAKYRKEALKAYGNSIVPQVVMELFTAIREAHTK